MRQCRELTFTVFGNDAGGAFVQKPALPQDTFARLAELIAIGSMQGVGKLVVAFDLFENPVITQLRQTFRDLLFIPMGPTGGNVYSSDQCADVMAVELIVLVNQTGDIDVPWLQDQWLAFGLGKRPVPAPT